MFKCVKFGFTFSFLVFPFTASAYGQATLLYKKDGVAFQDQFGHSVAYAGDVNGDGTPDFIIGAPEADPGGLDRAGCAYVYSGANGTLLYQKNGTSIFDRFGSSVAYAGDVDGDGRDDFIIGARFADPGGLTGAGSAYVYSGATGILLHNKNGAASGDALGFSVASAGDVNNDGKADFIVGAFGADPGGLGSAGSAYVYSGAMGALLYQKDGATVGDQLGFSVASAGEVDGDGRPDFIISARLADSGMPFSAGSAYVYSGATGTLLHQKDGVAAFDMFGSL